MKVVDWIIGSVLVICILFMLLPVFTPTPPPSPGEIALKQERTDNLQVRFFTKDAVESILKAPASAKWQNPNDFELDKIESNVWIVSGYVDSQNSFGAMLRTHFTVKSMKENDKWVVIDAKLK